MSENPRGAGVPAAVSGGGGVGLPDLPRAARGFGAAPDLAAAAVFAAFTAAGLSVDFGVLAITADYGAARGRPQGGASLGKIRPIPMYLHSGGRMQAANQSDVRAWSRKQVRALRPMGYGVMLAFLMIFSAALAGFAGVAPWAIAAAAIGLASLSYTKYQRLYQRGQELGLSQLVESTMLRSFFNALVASGAAFGFGWLVRVFWIVNL